MISLTCRILKRETQGNRIEWWLLEVEGEEKGEVLVLGYKLSIRRWVSTRDLTQHGNYS